MHPTYMVLTSATLSNEIFCGSFLVKNLVIFVPSSTVNRISFRNRRNRTAVGGKHNILVHFVDVSASDPSVVLSSVTLTNEIFCCSFIVKNLVVLCLPQ